MKNSKFLEMYNLIMEQIIHQSGEGLTNRKSGEMFISNANPEDKIFFQNLQYINSDQFKEYLQNNNIQLIDPKNSINQKIGIYKKNLNNLIKDKLICIAVFLSNDGEKIGFAKYCNSQGQKWNQTSGSSGFRSMYGYVYGKKKGQSCSISAGDFVNTTQFLTSQEVYQKCISSINTKHILSQNLKKYLIQILNFFTGKDEKFPIQNQGIDQTDIVFIKNQFGQILGGLALLNNKNIKNAESFYQKYDIANNNSTISFNKGKNDMLFDSRIKNSKTNEIIAISSKAKSGGKASLVGLSDRVETLNQYDKKIYKKQIEIFNIIKESSQYMGSIEIIKKILINDQNFLKFFQDTFKQPLTNEIITELISVYSSKAGASSFKSKTELNGNYIGSKKLNKFSLKSDEIHKSNNFYNIIAGITKCVVNYLNFNTKQYHFQDFLNLLLSKNFLQIHLNDVYSNKLLSNFKFEIKDLKNQKYHIKLNSGSNYQSNQCLGKIKFQIKGQKDI